MPKLPQISGKEMGRTLIRLGFSFKSQKGSHLKYVRGREIIVVPNHRVLRKGTMHRVLKQLNLSIEKLQQLR